MGLDDISYESDTLQIKIITLFSREVFLLAVSKLGLKIFFCKGNEKYSPLVNRSIATPDEQEPTCVQWFALTMWG